MVAVKKIARGLSIHEAHSMPQLLVYENGECQCIAELSDEGFSVHMFTPHLLHKEVWKLMWLGTV